MARVCISYWSSAASVSDVAQLLVGGTRDTEDRFWEILASFENISSENAEALEAMNSNRKIDISLDGTLLFYTTNLNAFVLTPAVRTWRVRALKDINVLVA